MKIIGKSLVSNNGEIIISFYEAKCFAIIIPSLIWFGMNFKMFG